MFNKRTILRLNEIWSKDWFDEIKGLLTPFLQASGFNLKVRFVPVSALKGVNVKPKAIATASSHTNLGDDALLKKWYKGPTLPESIRQIFMHVRIVSLRVIVAPVLL